MCVKEGGKRGVQAENTKVERRSEREQRQEERQIQEKMDGKNLREVERSDIVYSLRHMLSQGYSPLFFRRAIIVPSPASSSFLFYLSSLSFPFIFMLTAIFHPQSSIKTELVQTGFCHVVWSHLHLHYVVGIRQMLPAGARKQCQIPNKSWTKNCDVICFCVVVCFFYLFF